MIFDPKKVQPGDRVWLYVFMAVSGGYTQNALHVCEVVRVNRRTITVVNDQEPHNHVRIPIDQPHDVTPKAEYERYYT